MQVWSLPKVLAEGRLHRHVKAGNMAGPSGCVLGNGLVEVRLRRIQDTS